MTRSVEESEPTVRELILRMWELRVQEIKLAPSPAPPELRARIVALENRIYGP